MGRGEAIKAPPRQGFWGVVAHPEPTPKPQRGGAGFAPKPQNKATILYLVSRLYTIPTIVRSIIYIITLKISVGQYNITALIIK